MTSTVTFIMTGDLHDDPRRDHRDRPHGQHRRGQEQATWHDCDEQIYMAFDLAPACIEVTMLVALRTTHELNRWKN